MYKALVYDKKIAQDATATQQSAALGSTFQITVTAKPGHTVEELEAAIDHEVDSLATIKSLCLVLSFSGRALPNRSRKAPARSTTGGRRPRYRARAIR